MAQYIKEKDGTWTKIGGMEKCSISVGSLISQYKKKPMSGYLYCDGSTFDENVYPALYMYLGTNVLPDYRECVMVGAEQNTTDTIATHDVYGEGEFKDDQLQTHQHYLSMQPNGINLLTRGSGGGATGWNVNMTVSDDGYPIYASPTSMSYCRKGDTTHGKQKAVYVYIKATSGLEENQQDTILKNVKDYVDRSNSYLTLEVNTGGKWIDGKPIYRKVVTYTLSDALTGLVTVPHNIQNLETPIRIVCGNVSNPDIEDGGVVIPAQYSSDTFVQLGAFSSTYVQLYCGSSSWTEKRKVMLCLEYTKTTD